METTKKFDTKSEPKEQVVPEYTAEVKAWMKTAPKHNRNYGMPGRKMASISMRTRGKKVPVLNKDGGETGKFKYITPFVT